MLANEGKIEVSAAERGVRGRSVARQLVQNSATFGMSQAMRSRGLTQAGYQARETYGDINIQLKGQLNQSFSRVAIQPIPDFEPPKPVMQSPGLALMLGMGQALGAGIEGNPDFFKPKTPVVKPPTQSSLGGAMIQGNFMPSMPNYVGVGANTAFQGYY